MARGPDRLEEGAFSHPECASCVSPRAVKNPIDEKTRWVVKRRRCQGRLVHFSLVLQRRRPQGWTDVTRYSVAHANFHQYVHSFSRHNRRVRSVFGPIDRVEQIEEAYRVAIRDGFRKTEKWLSVWRRSLL